MSKRKTKIKKLALFIDYANLWSTYKQIWKTIDFIKLINYLEKEFEWKLEFKSIYFAYPKESTRNYDVSWIHKFSHFLSKELGFHIKKKVYVFSTQWQISSELKIHSSKYYDIINLPEDIFNWKLRYRDKTNKKS